MGRAGGMQQPALESPVGKGSRPNDCGHYQAVFEGLCPLSGTGLCVQGGRGAPCPGGVQGARGQGQPHMTTLTHRQQKPLQTGEEAAGSAL